MIEIISNAITAFLVPILLLVGGFKQKNNPPKTINRKVGFRTKLSMESQEAWDYANKQIGVYWVKIAVIELAVSAVVVIAISLSPISSFVTKKILLVILMVIESMALMLPINKVNKELIELKQSNNKREEE